MTEILVAGAGAIGSFLAARLSAAGLDPCLLARGSRLSEIEADGIRFEAGGLIATVSVPAVAEFTGPDEVTFVIICVKTGDLDECLDAIVPAVGRQTVLVTVQNGVDAPDRATARFPQSPVLAARVHGFFERAGGTVRHVGVEPSIRFGPWTNADAGHAMRLGKILEQAGIASSLSGDTRADLWEKFVLASTFGGIGAATGLLAGGLRRDVRAWALFERAVTEACRLAVLCGVELAADTALKTTRFVLAFPDDASTSMMRDLEAGGPSEYADLTGAVLRMATENGLDVPAFREIEAMIAARGLLPG